MQQILPYMNEGFILLSAVFIALGWRKIRQRQMEAHKRLMIIGTVFASLFFIGYLVKTVVVGDTTFGGPEHLQVPYQIFLQIHSLLATVAAVLGIVTLRLAYKNSFGKHKKIGLWTAGIWLFTVADGLVVFLMLYIIYPPGPTTNMFRAWLGF